MILYHYIIYFALYYIDITLLSLSLYISTTITTYYILSLLTPIIKQVFMLFLWANDLVHIIITIYYYKTNKKQKNYYYSEISRPSKFYLGHKRHILR